MIDMTTRASLQVLVALPNDEESVSFHGFDFNPRSSRSS